ncbi:hypothetical protein HAX54_043952, partial [Datura stramonium]|nr:hypothetical protein [Datura stramonium]
LKGEIDCTTKSTPVVLHNNLLIESLTAHGPIRRTIVISQRGRCIGSWVCTKDPTFVSSFNDRQQRAVVNYNNPLISINKKQQAVSRTKGNCKKAKQIRDELESYSSSGLEVHYNTASSTNLQRVTTRKSPKPKKLSRHNLTSPPPMREVTRSSLMVTTLLR